MTYFHSLTKTQAQCLSGSEKRNLKEHAGAHRGAIQEEEERDAGRGVTCQSPASAA